MNDDIPVPEELSKEDLARALAHFRDGMHADKLLLEIQLAALSHPEKMQAALASVFDLSAIVESHRQLMAVLGKTQADAAEARRLAAYFCDKAEALEKRIEGTTHQMEAMHKRLEKMNQWLDGMAVRAKQLQQKPTNGHLVPPKT